MKIAKVAKLCKRQNIIEIVDQVLPGGHWQYIGNGCALYSMDGMPKVNQDDVFGVLDIPRDKKKTFTISRFNTADMGLSFLDNLESDTPVYVCPVELGFNGSGYTVLYTDVGVRIIESVYLDPMGDIPYTLWLRCTRSGNTRIIVKNMDYQLIAVIEASRVPDNVRDTLKDIIQGVTTHMVTDPDTGELIEHVGEDLDGGGEE